MKERKMLGEFIYQLRREKGLSQAELGQLVGVSNKAVSKWETDEANPEIGLILKLAEIFNISSEELLSCKLNQENLENNEKSEKRGFGSSDDNDTYNENKKNNNSKDNPSNGYCFFNLSKGTVVDNEERYEFISDKKTKKGLPYLHITYGRNKQNKNLKAKGVVAIGRNATGVIALGLIAKGFVSLGLLSFGFVSFGLFSIGLISLGVLAISLLATVGAVAISLGVSVGAVAIGTIAIGAVAVGYLAVGAISVGYYAHTGINGVAVGVYKYYHFGNMIVL